MKDGTSSNDESARIAAHFSGRVVLVTGAFGFIGSHVSARLAAAGASLTLLHRRDAPGPAPDGARLVRGDLLNHELWEPLLDGVDTVFHLAAQTSTKASEADPILDYRSNAEATWRLLEACRRSGRRIEVVLAGTVTQHGKPQRLPLTGSEPSAPMSFYDLHKQLAEEELEFYARREIVRGACLRLPTLYGPGTREGSADCGVVNAMIRSALAGEALTVYGSGDRLRDFVHVEDAARAFLLAACALERCSGRHFLVGSGAPMTLKDAVREIASRVEQELGRAVPVVHVDPPADEVEIAKQSFSADLLPFERAADYRPLWPFSQGIDQTVRYFRNASAERSGRLS